MLDDLKQALLENPQSIVDVLEHYGFEKIKYKAGSDSIRCARDEDGNPSSISIRVRDNAPLLVTDFARGITNDLFGYIAKTKDVPFKDVLATVRDILKMTGYDTPSERKKSLFGGLFDAIGRSRTEAQQPIPEESLQKYDTAPNIRFYEDGISFETQRAFGIGYSVADQRITIPIRNAYGDLIGVKGRCNYEPDIFEPKYLYLEPCQMSSTLYGYCENYPYFYESQMLIFESEKSVMQAYSMGCRKAVALGSHSLSDEQARLITQAHPKAIYFMLDKTLPLECTMTNIKRVLDWDVFHQSKIYFFDWTNCDLLRDKDSPTDRGPEVFKEVLKKYMREVTHAEEDTI